MRFINQKNQAILREMIATDFKVRYQGSILGYAWSVLKPLFIFAILYVVFVKFLRIGGDVPHFPVYLLLGIVLWTFFNEATMTTMTSIVARGDLIKKISIPRYLVVLSSAFSAFINLGFNFFVLIAIAYINGVTPMWSWLILPLFIIELFVVALAIGFFLSALYVKYRDASYIWEVVLQAGFYAVPILYPLTMVAEQYRPYLMINPLAQIIQDSRWAFISHDPSVITSWNILHGWLLFVPFVLILTAVIVSVKYFKQQSRFFAENI